MDRASKSWTLIDEVLLPKLPHLDKDDLCYYYLVRSSGGYSASTANDRIDNFKKKPERYRDVPSVWKHKLDEIQNFADDIAALLNKPALAKIIADFQPVAITAMPTSKPKSDPFYDTRIDDLCAAVTSRVKGVGWISPFDIVAEVRPSHENGPRDVESLQASISFDGFPRDPGLVILVDDVLTTGAHFAACRNIIKGRYPNTPIVGVFLSIHRSSYVNWGLIQL